MPTVLEIFYIVLLVVGAGCFFGTLYFINAGKKSLASEDRTMNYADAGMYATVGSTMIGLAMGVLTLM